MKILLIAGHGAGDPGAGGNGYWEADKTREALPLLKKSLQKRGVNVTTYPTSRNAYADIKGSGPAYAFKNYDAIIEIHFNAYNGKAYGTETLYKTSKSLAAAIDKAIASKGFQDRGPKIRTDLQNMNYAASLSVPYVLIETCFIDSRSDMELYEEIRPDVWQAVGDAVADYYGLAKGESKISISGANWPEELTKGDRFVITGKVKSNLPLKSVTVVVERAATRIDVPEATKKRYTGATTFSLKNIDPYIAFRKLPAGSFRYKVKAEDVNGFKKTLVSKVFQVKAKK